MKLILTTLLTFVIGLITSFLYFYLTPLLKLVKAMKERKKLLKQNKWIKKMNENIKCFKCEREIKGKSYSGYENGMPWFCCGLCLRKQEKVMFKSNE